MERDAPRGDYLERLVAECNEARTGPSSFEGRQFGRSFRPLVWVLSPLFDTCSIGWALRERLTWKALIRVANTPPITAESLIKAVQLEVEVQQSMPKSRYVLATHTNVRHLRARTLSFGDSKLVLSRGLPSSYEQFRSMLAVEPHGRAFDWHPVGPTGMRVFVDGTDPMEAFRVAVGILQLHLGLVALAWSRNYGTLGRMHSGVAIGPFRVGPVLTIHLPRGRPANGHLETTGTHDIPATPVTLDKSTWEAFRTIRQKLAHHHYKEQCETALRWFGTAIAAPDSPNAALQLWSILETMTNARGKGQRAVYRTAALFEDRDLVTILLDFLRQSRNEFAHSQSDYWGLYMDDVVGRLADIARALIEYHLFVRGRPSFEQACSNLARLRKPMTT